MTKDEALALKNGDVIYLIDDSHLSILEQGAIKYSPILRRIVIGEPGSNYGNKPIHVCDATGCLSNASVSVYFTPEFFFNDSQTALNEFQAHAQAMREALFIALDKLDEQIGKAQTLISDQQAKQLQK